MHVYRMPRCVKRHDIVKEILMFALWSLESDATHVKAKVVKILAERYVQRPITFIVP